MGAKCCPCSKDESQDKTPELKVLNHNKQVGNRQGGDGPGGNGPGGKVLLPDPSAFVKLKHVVCQVLPSAELDRYKCVLLFLEPKVPGHTHMQQSALKSVPDIEEEAQEGLLAVKRVGTKQTVIMGLVDEAGNLQQCFETAVEKLKETKGETLILLEKESLESGALASEESIMRFARVFVHFCKEVKEARIIDILTNTEHNLTQALRLEMCR